MKQTKKYASLLRIKQYDINPSLMWVNWCMYDKWVTDMMEWRNNIWWCYMYSIAHNKLMLYKVICIHLPIDKSPYL